MKAAVLSKKHFEADKKLDFSEILGDNRLFQEYVVENLNLVKSVVNEVLRSFPSLKRELVSGSGKLSYDDLVNEGVLGFYRARETYDLSSGFKFTTYAVYWIRAFVLRCIKHHYRFIYCAPPSGVSVLSLDRTLTEDSDSSFADFLVDEKDISESLVKEQIKELAEKILSFLDEEELLVFKMKFYENLSYSEIGRRLGMKRYRVVRIRDGAIKKIKERLKREDRKLYDTVCDMIL